MCVCACVCVSVGMCVYVRVDPCNMDKVYSYIRVFRNAVTAFRGLLCGLFLDDVILTIRNNKNHGLTRFDYACSKDKTYNPIFLINYGLV